MAEGAEKHQARILGEKLGIIVLQVVFSRIGFCLNDVDSGACKGGEAPTDCSIPPRIHFVVEK